MLGADAAPGKTYAAFPVLPRLEAAVGHRFAGGVWLYDGETRLRVGDSLYAIPIRAHWEQE